jgi:hypothetical protein
MPSVRAERAERQLILLSAGTAARRREMCERARELASEVDWPSLTHVLALRKLLPTLGPRVVELSADMGVDELAGASGRAVEAGRRRGELLQMITLRMIAMLAEAGIPSAPLKGPLLGERIYGDAGRRLSSDIDLLVAPERLSDAVEVVRTLGYGAPGDYVDSTGLPQLHYVLVHERGALPPVEVHWRVHWYERRFAHERLLPAVVDGMAAEARELWRPEPADELAALLLFYARDGFVDLRAATDLGAWWDVYGEELAPGALAGLLEKYPELVRAIVAAVHAAERVVGLPAWLILGREPRMRGRGRMAVRLANPNPRESQSQLYADMGLIDGLLAPPGGLRAFARRQLLPPAAVRDQQARHGSRERTRSALGRGMGVLGRYAVTMSRLGRRPETLG